MLRRVPRWVWPWLFLISVVLTIYFVTPVQAFAVPILLFSINFLWTRSEHKRSRNRYRQSIDLVILDGCQYLLRKLLYMLRVVAAIVGVIVLVICAGAAVMAGAYLLPGLLEKTATLFNDNPSSDTSSNPIPRATPTASKPKYDPAVSVKDQVYFFEDTRFPNLTTKDYEKAVGDLARIQYKMIKNRGQAKNYPNVLVGNATWGDEACNELLPTLGLYQYGRGCDELITINFEANNINYEYQIEVLVTLAHEWGHHLINLSGENISGITNELLADCFAGIYLAYLDKHRAITEQELRNTVKMMGDLGNTHGTGIHGTPAQRVNSLLSGALYFDDPNDPKNQANWDSYCRGLEDVIDVRKSLP